MYVLDAYRYTYTQYLSVFPQFQSDYITTCSLQQFAGLLVERENIIAGLSLHEEGRAAVMEDHGGWAAVGGGWVVVTQTLTKHQSTPAGREREREGFIEAVHTYNISPIRYNTVNPSIRTAMK